MVQDKYAYIYNKVKDCLEKERIFLRADLSLKSFSRVIGTNTVYLSRTINQGFGCSFSTLINKYRLEYIIDEAVTTGDNISDIAAKYGLWSRSTFYELFRQYTGDTPQRYMEKRKDESKKYEV